MPALFSVERHDGKRGDVEGCMEALEQATAQVSQGQALETGHWLLSHTWESPAYLSPGVARLAGVGHHRGQTIS